MNGVPDSQSKITPTLTLKVFLCFSQQVKPGQPQSSAPETLKHASSLLQARSAPTHSAVDHPYDKPVLRLRK